MGLFGTALAYGLWIRGVTALPASCMQFLALLSPAVATTIGWVALGQSLSPVQLAGAGLVLGAVIAGQRRGAGSRRPRGRGRAAPRRCVDHTAPECHGVAACRAGSRIRSDTGVACETAHIWHVNRADEWGSSRQISRKPGHSYMAPLDKWQVLH